MEIRKNSHSSRTFLNFVSSSLVGDLPTLLEWKAAPIYLKALVSLFPTMARLYRRTLQSLIPTSLAIGFFSSRNCQRERISIPLSKRTTGTGMPLLRRDSSVFFEKQKFRLGCCSTAFNSGLCTLPAASPP